MPLTVNKTFSRLWSVESGKLMVVTDLHGNWEAYQRHRDRFLAHHSAGEADGLIFLGDLIHPHSESDPDHSLDIVLDVMALQEQFGEAVIYLCGNHELPHIYHFTLHKGKREYTAQFEQALSKRGKREEVLALYDRLPFFVRTPAGVSLTHAGATPEVTSQTHAHQLFNWNHAQQIEQAKTKLSEMDIAGLRRAVARLSHEDSYEAMACHYLAVSEPNDPRFDDLLIGMFATEGEAYQRLYDTLFTKCEHQYGLHHFKTALKHLLANLSNDYAKQQVLVAGHITIKGGFQVINKHHLRLASSHHATPHQTGCYLLFDVQKSIVSANELVENLYTAW